MSASYTKGRGRIWTASAIAAVAAVLVAAAIVGQRFVDRRDGGAAASPSPTAASIETSRASPSETSAATSSPAGALVTHENLILGYRISLPGTYRRSGSSIITGREFLGVDTFTVQTEAEERAECLRDGGDIPPPNLDAYIHVEAHRNPRGVSAAEWARASPRSTHHTVQPVTIDGREAASLVQQGMTTSYVMSANERIYVLALATWPSQHRIADIAATFRAVTPQPFPTPTPPSQAPRDAARELALMVVQAFAARDADAVARLMPECKINVTSIIGSVPQGGALHRSVALFVTALRERFARGDLTVTVDPDVQVEVQGGSEQFFVRSAWSEPDRTTPIDLFLAERDGRWQWALAVHHYPSLVGNSCIPYRSPWVSGTGSC